MNDVPSDVVKAIAARFYGIELAERDAIGIAKILNAQAPAIEAGQALLEFEDEPSQFSRFLREHGQA